jgi:hypothetical protein
MDREIRIRKKEGFNKDLYGNKGWRTDCEGMERNEIPLGPVANGLYFRKGEKRMFLLQKT